MHFTSFSSALPIRKSLISLVTRRRVKADNTQSPGNLLRMATVRQPGSYYATEAVSKYLGWLFGSRDCSSWIFFDKKVIDVEDRLD